MGYKTLIYTLLSFLLVTACSPRFEKEITAEELKSLIGFLAGDSLKGRFPGTPEDEVMTQYIVNAFDDAGLVLMAEDGSQEFHVDYGYTVGTQNAIRAGQTLHGYMPGGDFYPLGFSATDTVSGTILASVDRDAGADPAESPEGRVLSVPLPEDLPESGYDAYNVLREIALDASDRGAVAVLFVAGGEAPLPVIEHPKRLTLPVPAILIGQELYGDILDAAGADPVEIMAEILPVRVPTWNTVAHLRGSDAEVREQYVIIGAHHDHLGMGGRGSSSRMQDTVAIHYGADDNASGVAGVIEIAEKVVSESPARSFAFVTFGAEEMGLFGSKYFADHPTMDLEKVQVMINMDMVGRLNEKRQLQISGTGTSPAFRTLIDSVNLTYNFNLKYSDAGYGPSDHSSFYAMDIPVLFISTGAHTDYHTPMDTDDRLNYEGLTEVLAFVSDIALKLGNLPERLEFTMAGPKTPARPRSGYGKVTLGLMPDVTYEGNDGMPVSFVTEGKPAAAGGMKDGDIIIAVDGKRVGNVYDYMSRLEGLEPGQSIIVRVLREDEELELLIQL